MPKLNLRNWECGVVVPVPIHSSAPASTTISTASAPKGEGNDGFGGAQGNSVSMDVFANTVPVPMVIPGESYNSRRPWFC